MDKRIQVLAAHLLGLVLLSCGPAACAASDEAAAEAPNPFKPPPVHKESISSKWRHGFDTVRTTWEEYFKVFPEELQGFESTTLEKIKAAPVFYVDRKVQFDIYYGKPGSYYRPFTTPFQQDVHANFAGWSYGGELWIKEVRAGIHPLFYVDRHHKELIDKIEHLPIYTPLRLWAVARSKTDNLAWFEVMDAKVIPETALNEATLRHIELGAIQLAKKRYDMAAQAFEGALKLQLPVNAEADVYGMLGRAYYEQRLYTAARNALVSAILRDERDVPNLVLLARTDLRVGKSDEARQAAERAIAADPANAGAHAELGLALALLDDVRNGYKEFDVAQKLARNLLPEANRNRALVLAREGKLEAARDELKQAIITRPTDVDFKLELGDLYIALNQLELAKTEFTQARDLAPQRADTHYRVAVVLKRQADGLKKEGKEDAAKKGYEEALENVKNALSKDDQFTPAYGLQAEILRALGRADDAKKVLENGARRNSKDPALQELLYEQALAVGDWGAMEQAARAALAIEQSAAAFLRLGNVLVSRPNPDVKAAAEAYEEAIRLAPDNAEYWAVLGHLRVSLLDDAKGAETVLSHAVKLDPKNGGAWADLALAQRNLGKAKAAAASTEKAVALGQAPEGAKKPEEPVPLSPAATPTTAKRSAPIIEEPEGGEPTPIQVPGPR